MRSTRRTLVGIAALAVSMALMTAATAAPPNRECEDPKWADHPSCSPAPDPDAGVGATVEQNLGWVHEAGDQIHYTIEITNGSDGPVTATSSLTGSLPGAVPAGGSEVFLTIYTVAASDVPGVPGVTWDVTNVVEVLNENGALVASASSSAEAGYLEPCLVNQPFTIDPDTATCILNTAKPGTYTIEVTRDTISRPTSAFITVRDHSPGNVCGREDTKWNPSKQDGPFSLALTVSLPQDPIGLPGPWIGSEPECAEIPVGSEYFAIGSSGSFYVTANGGSTVTITNS